MAGGGEELGKTSSEATEINQLREDEDIDQVLFRKSFDNPLKKLLIQARIVILCQLSVERLGKE